MMTVMSNGDLRILFVVNLFPPAYTGGAEIINHQTCRQLRQEGVECSIFAVNNRGPDPVDETYEYAGVPVRHRVFSTRGRRAWRDVFDWRVYRAVSSQLRRQRPHLVHIHNVSGATLAPYLACRTEGVPVVNTLHDFWLLCPNNMLYRRDGSFCDPGQNPGGCKACFRRYDFWGNIPYRRSVFARLTSNVRFFISPSQALIDLHVQAGYERGRFRLVRHGLGPNTASQPLHPRVRAVISSRSRFRTLVFAGGGIEIKGAEVLLEALPTILRHVEGVRLIVAGAGEKQILSRFREQGPAVQVLGQVPPNEIGHLFAAADLVLVPSTCAESFSLVTLESLQVGTPVVGSALGGIPELIDEGQTGYLFPAGDPTALAERVILHFARPSVAQRSMRRRCRPAVQSKVSLEKHVQGVLQVYQEALSH
jgi:glycosyltransferase involved in cell wall biosynthesis